MEKVIEIINLCKAYNNGRGITDINIDIFKGDIFGFLGPNGSGKTTAMKIMTGLIRADIGEVKILGHNIEENFELAMAKVGSIIETAESYPFLTAYEKPRNYSLGMKQRLGIAAAILSRSEIIILDEPLNGLDVEGMVAMRNLIKGLAEQENTTFFISSHLIHDVEITCNRMGVIYDGKMINTDTTENILNNYASLENYFISDVERNGRI